MTRTWDDINELKERRLRDTISGDVVVVKDIIVTGDGMYTLIALDNHRIETVDGILAHYEDLYFYNKLANHLKGIDDDAEKYRKIKAAEEVGLITSEEAMHLVVDHIKVPQDK